MCGSRKYPYLHHRESLEIPRWRGAKIFKESMRLNWKPSLGVYGYFLEQHNVHSSSYLVCLFVCVFVIGIPLS